MRETPIAQRIAKVLRSRGAFVLNVHGSSMQARGLPDLVVCYRGLYFGIEVKIPGKEPTEIQLWTMSEIQKAGGYAGVATTPEEALNVLRQAFTDI